MTLGARIRERAKMLGISQAEVGRRADVAQSTINTLVNSAARTTPHLIRLARVLQTSPAYLMGETDDPDENAPPLPFIPTPPQIVMMGVTMPPERALVRMFEALLAGIDPDASREELALLLGQRLPIGLSQLRDLLPDSVTVPPRQEREDADEARATLHPEPIR